ncbi:AMP-binding protein [Micromonospora sp. NPDC052213]|uniref:non-ribosomal peptide synthetase n=1 Tax=Micromonospora sp. NPDC052213 TaxID=3155812 RepID=UPI00342016F0
MTTDAPTTPSRLAAAAADVQDGIWYVTRLHADAPAPTVRRAYWVTGDIDVEALCSAWRAVLDRHEALRTTVATVDGRPVRRVNPVHRDAVEVRDVRDGAPAVLPGDLGAGPSARMTVLRVTPRHHRIVLAAHQAVADDVSMSLVAGELSTGYADAVRAPRPASAPPRHHSEHPPHRTEATICREAADRWLAELDPPPPAASLPVYRPASGTPTVADEVTFDWERDLCTSVRALARAEGTAPLTIVLAALQVALGRYGGDDTLTVAMPVCLRGPGEEGTVGPLSTLVPVVGRLTATTTFREHLRRTARRRRSAETHGRLPFPRLVRGVNPPRPVDGIPLCDAVLAEGRHQGTSLRLAGATVHELRTPAHTLLADLMLTVSPAGPSLAGTLAYRADRMGRSTAEGLLAHLRTLLTAAVRNPDVAIADLPLETSRQLATAVRDLDATADPPTPARPVPDLIRECAERFPEAVAVRCEEEGLTYAELVTRATGLAAWLRARVPVTDRAVAVRLNMGPALVTASLAVLLAGGHVVWMSPDDTGERAAMVLTDLRPAVVLLGGDPADDPLADWYRAERGGQVLALPTEPTARAVATPCDIDLASAAYAAFTSGSTGRPKGVVQTHAALAQFATWLAHIGGLGPGSRVAQWAAVEHDPSLCEVFAALISGATLVPVPGRVRAHPERFVRWLDREGVTLLQTVPSFARELAVAMERDGAVPNRLTHLILMGEALAASLANQLRRLLPHTRLWNVYGPTETVAASAYRIDALVRGERVPIGRPIPGRQVLVVDEWDRPCPTGVTGEIVVRSPYAVPGYLPGADGQGRGDAAFRPLRGADAAASPTAGCYRTGDLGRRRFDGTLEHVGRLDHQVKLAGHRLELAAVEAVLAEHPLVADCAVAAVADPDGLVSRLVAFVVARHRGDWQTLVTSLRTHLRRRYGPVIHRASFVALDGVPRNVGGKVDRTRLPDPVLAAGSAAGRDPTATEQEIGRLWAELLPAGPADVHHSFFAAGGHSLLLARLAHRLTERFGVDVSVAELVTAPTVAGMAALVRAAAAGCGDSTAGGAFAAAGPTTTMG